MTNQFKKCIWLIKTIYSRPITYEEINDKWMRSSLNINGGSLPKRTLHNHLQSIRELFDINITCDRKNDYRYRLDITSAQDKLKMDLLFNLFLKMSISDKNSLEKKIYDMELNLFFPKFFFNIVEAIENQYILSIIFRNNYNSPALKKEHPNSSIDFNLLQTRQKVDYFKPIGLVKVDNTWYMIGRSKMGYIHIFDANRIVNYTIVGKDDDKKDLDFNTEDFTLNYKKPTDLFKDKEYSDNELLFHVDIQSVIFRKQQYEYNYTFEEWNNTKD